MAGVPCPGSETASSTVAGELQRACARLAHAGETARLDAEVLLAFVLDRNRTYLKAWPERALTAADTERFRDLVERRREGMPVAYLTGEREFWSRPFRVEPGVLIPRPETELLIELALALIPPGEPWNILDLGTGSGIIAISLASERPETRITASDLSPEALAVARANAARHAAGNVRLVSGNWFGAVPDGKVFDLIVSNPPYVADDDRHLGEGDVRFEPDLALRGGPLGLDALTVIAAGARERLAPGGRLLVEHGWDQAPALAQILRELGYRDITHHRDLQGHPRVTSAGRALTSFDSL